MDRELLAKYGIDYDKGIANCMGDRDFFKVLLSMFLKDDCFPRAQTAHDAGDYKELFACMHELKGVSGNAALIELYKAVLPLVELLRNGTDDTTEVDRLFALAQTAYGRTCEGIALAVA